METPAKNKPFILESFPPVLRRSFVLPIVLDF